MSIIDKNTDYIKVEGKLEKIIYPRYPAILGEEGSEWGITSWRIDKVIENASLDIMYAPITVKGNFPITPDERVTYTLVLKEVEDLKYGMQYEILYLFTNIDLTEEKGLRTFLTSFMTEGQIQEVLKVYTAEEFLKFLEEKDYGSITAVYGIGYIIAEKICDRFDYNRDFSSLYIELDEYDFTSALYNKLIKVYKSPDKVIDIVKNHPYQLIRDVEGIGFVKADQIASKAKDFKPTNPDRIGAFITYFLQEMGENGHSYVYSEELLEAIYDGFDGKENILETYRDENGDVIGNNINLAIETLKEKGILAIEENENKRLRKVYLTYYYNLEKAIAENLKRLLSAKNEFSYENWEQDIAELEQSQGWNYTDEQKAGIKLALDEQVCLVAGLAGTGKTSVVSGMLRTLKDYSFAQTSLSGKAAAHMQEVTGSEGKTIHRLLGWKKGEFTFNKENRLSYDIIILDEISLLNGEVFLALIEAIEDGSKLIMLGDLGQLEAIGSLNLAFDFFSSKTIPTVELTQVHRQAEKSGILTSAYRVRKQQQLFSKDFEGYKTAGELQDMHVDIYLEKDGLDKAVVNHFLEVYNSPEINKDAMKVQIITATKERGSTSVFYLNNLIQEEINPQRDSEEECVVEYNKKEKIMHIRKHDKVMCIKNKYKAKVVDNEEVTVDIFNGWAGEVVSVENGCLYVYFPLADNTVMFLKTEIKAYIMLAYACTTHKFQGSSCENIIAVIDYSIPPNMRTKELLYTMLTRAEKDCLLVGQNSAVRSCIENSYVSSKRTFMDYFLID